MATNKKRKRVQFVKKTEPKHWYDKTINDEHYNKTSMILFFVLVGIVIIAIVLIALFQGINTINSQGYDSADTTITGYFDGINSFDMAKLRRCYDISTKVGNERYNEQFELAQQFRNNVEINMDSLQIITEDYTGSIDDLKRNTKNNNISDAKISTVSFLTTEKKDDASYTRYRIHRVLTYADNGKWFIYARQEIGSATLTAVKDKQFTSFETENTPLDDTQIVGDATHGYLKIGPGWTQNESEITGDLVYENYDKTARISIGLIPDYDDIDLFAGSFTQALSDSENFLNVYNYPIKFQSSTAYLVTCVDSTMNQMFFTWIFDGNESSPELHTISLECVFSASDASSYVSSFAF